jgi:hypothetical protein
MALKQIRLAAVTLLLCVAVSGLADKPVKHAAPTTANVPSSDLTTVWYDIRDLTEDSELPPQGVINPDAHFIKKTITDNVQTNSWKDNGGDIGSVSSCGTQLMITQTPEAHRDIETLLAKLRQINATGTPIVTVDAYWVRLLPSQLPAGETAIDPQLLANPSVVFAHARTSGFEGTPVTVTYKRSASVVSGITPVVAPGVGLYDPQLSAKENDISFSEVASALHDDSLQIAFDSSVSTPEPDAGPARPTTQPSTMPSQLWPISINADNEELGSIAVELKAHSTIRLKLGTPTIVTGMSDRPGKSNDRTLCLVLCVTSAQPK